MPFKPKQSQLRKDNITEAKDPQYDAWKGILNGSFDRENIPEGGITDVNMKDLSFLSYYTKYMKVSEQNIDATALRAVTQDEMYGVPYNNYAGGYMECPIKLSIKNVREGMMHLELSLYYWLNLPAISGDDNTPNGLTNEDWGFIDFQLLYNGNAVAEVHHQMRALQSVYMCSSIPVATGTGEVAVRWRFNSRKEVSLLGPVWDMATHMMYWSGGNLLALNYYR